MTIFRVSGQFHLGRPVVDSPEAHTIFAAAERNRTPDGFLTKLELDDIFQTFDQNRKNSNTNKINAYICIKARTV